MSDSPRNTPPILSIYLQISRYPILAKQIRRRMREELYRRGIITRERLEAEVKEKAESSQRREGLTDPLAEERSEIWEQRLGQIRDQLTDFYFAYNLPLGLFESLTGELLAERNVRRGESGIPLFNPELTPVETLLGQLGQWEALSVEDGARTRKEIEEVTAVLVKTLISEQPGFVRLARSWLTKEDFQYVQSRRVGEPGESCARCCRVKFTGWLFRIPIFLARMCFPVSWSTTAWSTPIRNISRSIRFDWNTR
jgi:hypothetical protein